MPVVAVVDKLILLWTPEVTVLWQAAHAYRQDQMRLLVTWADKVEMARWMLVLANDQILLRWGSTASYCRIT